MIAQKKSHSPREYAYEIPPCRGDNTPLPPLLFFFPVPRKTFPNNWFPHCHKKDLNNLVCDDVIVSGST